MQEMTYDEIKKYFDIIKSNKAFFIVIIEKLNLDKLEMKIIFFPKMPWGNNEFLFKEKHVQ